MALFGCRGGWRGQNPPGPHRMADQLEAWLELETGACTGREERGLRDGKDKTARTWGLMAGKAGRRGAYQDPPVIAPGHAGAH